MPRNASKDSQFGLAAAASVASEDITSEATMTGFRPNFSAAIPARNSVQAIATVDTETARLAEAAVR